MKEPSWKKGRGKLGVFAPLVGQWRSSADTEMGRVTCVRQFEFVLNGKYVQLDADWLIAEKNYRYQERCLFGPRPDKTLAFWSFTSDGKHSEGWLSAAPDIHPQALCFEADMDAGRARQIYWPGIEGFFWAVESKNKKGWKRFVEHHYTSIAPAN